MGRQYKKSTDFKRVTYTKRKIIMEQNRRNDLDLLKTIAIIAVVFYHFGFFKYGYLGVDIFLVVSGYLTGKSLFSKLGQDDAFSFFKFIVSKLKRLLPVLCIGCFVSLLFGYIFMLPDDFENLSESVVASLCFSNNILSYLTTKDYWNISNNFRPLMHTWYLGILFEFYIVLGCIVKIFYKTQKKKKLVLVVLAFTVISLILYFLPFFSSSSKFYLIPSRFFEFGCGFLLIKLKDCDDKKWLKIPFCLSFLLLISLVFLPLDIFASSIRLVAVALLTSLIVFFNFPLNINSNFFLLGRGSYSIYVWHQIILAIYRYCNYLELNLISVLGLLFFISVISFVTYVFVENRKVFKPYFSVSVIMFALSLFIYTRAGVVRDVPELGIQKNNVYKNMNAAYCDRIYSYDKDFSENNQVKILVLGNSFARDFANILLESSYSRQIDLSYSFDLKFSLKQRIEQADYIFIFDSIVFPNDKIKPHDDLMQRLIDCGYDIKSDKLYGIGTKNFGFTMGSYYVRRFTNSYYEQRNKIDNAFIEQNEIDKKFYGNRFVDLITPVYSDGYIEIFNEKRFISADGSHLTYWGGVMYGKILELDTFFDSEEKR